MGLNIPPTEVIKDRNLANLEGSLGQTSPISEKAFLRVLAAMEALSHTELYKFAAERALQNLALTATGPDLDIIGAEFKTPRKAAEAANLTIELPAVDTTVIPATVDFIGVPNGARYFPDASAVAVGGIATLDVTAEEAGTAGNLNVNDTMTIGTQIAGAETVATVKIVNNVGAEEETDDVYRQRVLNAIRATCGGGNATDYKIWGEVVAGVERIYSYAGKPFDSLQTSYPGDRTLYVQADSTVDPDGIAPQSLLDEVRAAVNNDPVTSEGLPPLGLIDATLFVESIVRTSFFVRITNLQVSTDVEAAAKADIETALTTYFASLRPFVDGIDLAQERNDLITNITVADVVQDVLTTYGGSAEDVGFGLSVGSFLTIYRLNPGELSKLGSPNGVTYA